MQITALLCTLSLPLLAFSAATPKFPFTALEDRAGSTENGLSTEPCKAVTIIFARGTNEAGNVGAVAGPPWFTALRSLVGEAAVTVQGVAYSANVFGYLAGGDSAGSATMTRLIQQASTKCPNTKLVLGGYSQGAQLVHNAAERLSAAIINQIAAVVVFGDPDNGDAVGAVPRAKILNICHQFDTVCTGSGGYTTHLNYRIDAQTAANFVKARTGL